MPSSSISRFSRYEVNHLFNNIIKRQFVSGLTFLAASKSGPNGRILVITSRKSGSAAKRNRIRRRLKSIFFESGFFTMPYDIAVVVKKEGIETSFKELSGLLKEFINAISK